MAQDPGRVFPGKKMTGHMGDETVSVQNLDIVRVDEARSAAAGSRRCAGCEERPCRRAPRRQGQEGSQLMQLELLNEQGQATSRWMRLTPFARDYNEALVHQVVVAYQGQCPPRHARPERSRRGQPLDQKPFRQRARATPAPV